MTILAETLQLYCLLSNEPNLSTSSMRENSEIEVMLNQELGQCIDEYTKKHILVRNGKRIADILIEIRNAYTISH